jgi:two-component system nitrate/nitrite response regulator NarL
MRSRNGSIRVLVADDHPVYVDGLAAAIERTEDLELAGKCRDGAEALRQIRAQAPDVAVLDLRMPGLTAQAAAARSCRPTSRTAWPRSCAAAATAHTSC